VAQLRTAPAVAGDFDRLFDHVTATDPASAAQRVEDILQAIEILRSSPLIGRPVSGGQRELVIGRGSGGYVALYRYVEPADTVFVLALRGQREAGYRHD
jgi:toxin ParE1/3/4